MLHKLVFDATDAASLLASSNVGAFVRSADGTLITHTTDGAKEALDVHVVNDIAVDLSAAGGDSVLAWTHDGSGNAISSTGGALHISDAGGSITVDAADLDIRDLTHVSDSIRLGDGTNLVTSTTVGSDIGLDVFNLNDPSVAISSAIATTKDATGTAAAIVTAPLASRKMLYVYNNGNKSIFLGGSGVSLAAGFPVPPGAMLDLRAGPAVALEMITASGTVDVRTLELS